MRPLDTLYIDRKFTCIGYAEDTYKWEYAYFNIRGKMVRVSAFNWEQGFYFKGANL